MQTPGTGLERKYLQPRDQALALAPLAATRSGQVTLECFMGALSQPHRDSLIQSVTLVTTSLLYCISNFKTFLCFYDNCVYMTKCVMFTSCRAGISPTEISSTQPPSARSAVLLRALASLVCTSHPGPALISSARRKNISLGECCKCPYRLHSYFHKKVNVFMHNVFSNTSEIFS